MESTYSWVSALGVKKGDVVAAGTLVARSGAGHPGDLVPSVHMGVKLHDVYVDPLAYLSAAVGERVHPSGAAPGCMTSGRI